MGFLIFVVFGLLLMLFVYLYSVAAFLLTAVLPFVAIVSLLATGVYLIATPRTGKDDKLFFRLTKGVVAICGGSLVAFLYYAFGSR